MKSKRNLIILTLVIAISLIGVTYAFFDYYMLGANQKITAGKVNLTLNEGEDTIDRGNIFPETVTKARSRDNNFITFTVSGINTTEDQDIYYEIMLNEGDVEVGMTRFSPEDLVFDLIELDADGNEGTYLVDAMSFSDFNERRIWVDTITNNTSTTLSRTYKLRMWLSEDVFISDTNTNADYPSTGYENYYASVKVSVYGDFVEKSNPYNYMARLGTDTIQATFDDNSGYSMSNYTFLWPNSINDVRSNITEVHFISLNPNDMRNRYDNSSIKADMTDTEKSEVGSVLTWLENGELVTNDDGTQTQYYKMYIASDGTTYFPENSSYMFFDFKNLSLISFANIDTSNVNEMRGGFLNTALSTLNFSNWNTSNITNMSEMFFKCSSLTTLDLSDLDTSSVTNMSGMLRVCSSLTTLDLSDLDTSSVTNMSGMFDGCSSLTTLDLSDLDTSSVTDMSYMFLGCSSLTTLDLTTFNTKSVTTLFFMFRECSNLQELNLSSFEFGLSGVSYAAMFLGAYKDMVIKVGSVEDKEWILNNLNVIFHSGLNIDNIIVV